ncbi:TonB-dependent receptor plug domain-containing protein [Persicobacter psychrovividus]|uniref:TonB-dependent receptor plug domain-containing protein n=1 Tax=Persicobacter psychrovividus TaxID=387638 RepID=A0ABM7VBI7_9BACT|nr:hypothetical protein PEPS_05470 [Persicobacter psychrovividus]
MNKVLCLAVAIFFAVSTVFAQKQEVSGIVTSKENGDPLAGVNVLLKNQSLSTITDIDGRFSMHISEPNAILVFSFEGFFTEEVTVGSQSEVNVNMTADLIQLKSEVSTALDITREKSSLGYATQEISSSDLTIAQSTNVLAAVSGKVAGVQVSGSTGNMAGSYRLLVRGVNSILGNNQPLFVVDGVPLNNNSYNAEDISRGGGGYDYGNMAQDINPEDVESLNVLKGPAATALYGVRGANGVIIISTKSGKRDKKGIGVSVNSSVIFEKVNMMPKLQRLYGGGNGFTATNIGGTDYLMPDYDYGWSWGPAYDGQQVVLWNNIEDSPIRGSKITGTSEWKAPENDVSSFFETGVTFNNTVAFFWLYFTQLSHWAF